MNKKYKEYLEDNVIDEDNAVDIIDGQQEEIERLNNIIEDFEIELQREINVREEDTSLEHNTFIIIQNTLKTALKRFQELKGSDSNEN